MKISGFLTLLVIFLTFNLSYIIAQKDSIPESRPEFGIDFLSYNRNWVYYNDFLYPVSGKKYVLEAIPAIFVKLPMNKNILRFKIEYFQSHYLFNTHGSDMFQEVDGEFKEGRLLFGIEKYIIDKRIKIYQLIDCVFSFSNFKGLYTYSGGYTGSDGSELFNINAFGIALQPGFGIKYRLSDNINLSLESSVFFGKGFDKNDNHQINPENRLILLPVSLLGLSYSFKK